MARKSLEKVLGSGSGPTPRPALDKNLQSSVKGLYVVGDLAGAPVVKLAMDQAVQVVERIAKRANKGGEPQADVLDLVIVGAGAAGLAAALRAEERGLSYQVLEKEQVASTIENFPEGKWIYAEPDDRSSESNLWFEESTKEDLLAHWRRAIDEQHLAVAEDEPVESVARKGHVLEVTTSQGSYRARNVVLATGQRGNPRKLGVAGESAANVHHRLYSPKQVQGSRVLVVGGGNSAVEAALTMSEANTVVLSYRGSEFGRIFKDNRRKLDRAIAAGRIEVLFHSTVTEFAGSGGRASSATVEIDHGGHQQRREVLFDHAYALIGAELPVGFLKKLGLRLENEWTGSFWAAAAGTAATFLGTAAVGSAWGGSGLEKLGLQQVGIQLSTAWLGAALVLAALAHLVVSGSRGNRWSWLGLSFFVWYSVYGIKVGVGEEFWPYRGWGYQALSFFDRPWAFWYTVAYTGLMTVFGVQAMKRWGFDRKDRFQIWRYSSLIGFQWVFFFLIPEFLFRWAVEYQWVGQELATNPQFADNAWRSYGIVYAWPLFFYTWLYDPHQIWVVWGALLTFVLIPILVLFHGKRYCSWICGCGGLAETFGDRWRHLAPKGRLSIQLEEMATAVLIFAGVATAVLLTRDITGWWRTGDTMAYLYRIVADVWLVGILPVTLYPFLGGKIWCRYWCPLAKMMQVQSWVFTKFGWSRFAIVADEKCIACNECSRYCQVGIDVMQYAIKQETLDNETSSCIGCGICVSVCPMDTLSFETTANKSLPIVS